MDNSWDTNVRKWKSLKLHFYTVWLFTQIQLQIILFLLFWDALWIINDLLAPLSLFFHEFQQNSQFLRTISNYPDLGRLRISLLYWSGSSSRHFLRFLSNIFKKQSRNLCFTPLSFCVNHNDLPTKGIFIKENARWSGIHYYDVAIFNRKWPQQKQFSPTFRNIVFCEAKASKGKKNDILEN